ncbi:MAG: T9SS type A sorting domain-containing protein, partial [Bacteroidota bacterium]
ICYYNGTTWVPFNTGVTNTFYGVFGLGNGSGPGVWAVGSGGIICYYNGTAWVPQTSNVNARLNAVAFADPDFGFAVGDGGTILRTANGGTTWTRVNLGYTYHLNAVYCIDANNAVAVGDNGVVLVTTDGGLTWVLYSIGTTARLTDVSVNGCIAYISAANGGVFQCPLSNCNSSTFPVEWLAFKGEWTDEGAELSWLTATEQNNDFFQIERSVDGQLYQPIGQVDGQGNTQTVTAYHYLDAEVLSGNLQQANRLFYRLRQVDVDGQFSYSTVVELTRTPSLDLEVIVFPNPASTQLTLQLPMATKAEVVLFNLQGHQVAKYNLNQQYELTLSVSHLAEGKYFLRVLTEDGKVAQKVVGIR